MSEISILDTARQRCTPELGGRGRRCNPTEARHRPRQQTILELKDAFAPEKLIGSDEEGRDDQRRA